MRLVLTHSNVSEHKHTKKKFSPAFRRCMCAICRINTTYSICYPRLYPFTNIYIYIIRTPLCVGIHIYSIFGCAHNQKHTIHFVLIMVLILYSVFDFVPSVPTDISAKRTHSAYRSAGPTTIIRIDDKRQRNFATMADTQHFCLRWNNYQSSITSAFENLRDDEDFVDVTLACDGRSLKAHRVVLSACSPYFRELLKVSRICAARMDNYRISCSINHSRRWKRKPTTWFVWQIRKMCPISQTTTFEHTHTNTPNN